MSQVVDGRVSNPLSPFVTAYDAFKPGRTAVRPYRRPAGVSGRHQGGPLAAIIQPVAKSQGPRIYTKQGDTGETSLLFGGRVSKANPRTEAYGWTDQAVSAMGLGRALSGSRDVKEILLRVQHEMFLLGAELATDPAERDKLEANFNVVTAEMVERMEREIDDIGREIELPRSFIVPGGSAASSAIDLARTFLRTAERRVVSLHEDGGLANPEVLLRYLNRLSDLLFMLARLEDKDLPHELVTGRKT